MSGGKEDDSPHARHPITGAASEAAKPAERSSARTSVAPRTGEAERCPGCGAKRIGDDVFCEGCGYDFVSRTMRPTEATSAIDLWEAVVVPDRRFFERGEWQGISFPESFQTLVVPLEGPEVRIGRGELDGAQPDLDLDDPAVSRLHALLLRQEDFSYAIADQGSRNGTTLNDDPTSLAQNVLVPLKDGDRVHVGAWTTITVRRSRAGARD